MRFFHSVISSRKEWFHTVCQLILFLDMTSYMSAPYRCIGRNQCGISTFNFPLCSVIRLDLFVFYQGYSWFYMFWILPNKLDYSVAQRPHMYPPVAQKSPFLHSWGIFDLPVTLFSFSIMQCPMLTCTPVFKRIHPCFQNADQIQTCFV
jgi:hypothetical protein